MNCKEKLDKQICSKPQTLTTIQRKRDPWNENQALKTGRNLSLLGYSCILFRGPISSFQKWEYRSMHLCLTGLREHQGARLSMRKSEKRQCKCSPYNLNSSDLGTYEWGAVFNYLIIIYTRTEFAPQIAEELEWMWKMPQQNFSSLHFLCCKPQEDFKMVFSMTAYKDFTSALTQV